MPVPLRCLVVAGAFAHAAGYTARSHRAHLSLLAADTAVEGKGPSGEEKATTTTTCSQCGFNDKGVGNCCSTGGAWQGTCKEEGGVHTFVDGFNACVGANKMAAPPDLSDVVASEHGSEPETMPSLYAGAFEADKSAAPAGEKKHQFEAKGSAPDAEPAARAQAAPAEAAPAEAEQAAAPAAEAAPKLPALEDMPADAQQQAAVPAAAAEQAQAPKAAAPSKNADAVSAAEDEYLPYISPVSPVYLLCISPISPL
jgi:hypothetical protein